MTKLFDVTIHLAGGTKHTLRSMSTFKINEGGYTWECAGSDRILDFKTNKVDAVFYSVLPWYTKLFRTIFGV